MIPERTEEEIPTHKVGSVFPTWSLDIESSGKSSEHLQRSVVDMASHLFVLLMKLITSDPRELPGEQGSRIGTAEVLGFLD